MNPLAIIPSYPTSGADLEVLEACLKSLRAVEGDRLDILVVDDGSPDGQLRATTVTVAAEYDADTHMKKTNDGFSATVNVGLRRALTEGRDAILVNADLEAKRPFLNHMLNQQRLHGEGPAWVVGGLLTFPSGLIQHAGIYFSLLTREFNHLWKYAPANLPAALQPRACPVTGAFQLIRHEALTTVGLYDETFRMGYEDVDYCIRVFLADNECVYQPRVKALHHESMFRGRQSEKLDRWHEESMLNLWKKWHGQNFAGLVPSL